MVRVYASRAQQPISAARIEANVSELLHLLLMGRAGQAFAEVLLHCNNNNF
jgi:hypothetical protein